MEKYITFSIPIKKMIIKKNLMMMEQLKKT